MIVEPVLMNVGVIAPAEGYLAGLAERLHRNRSFLAFDEVKTGATIALRRRDQRYGVTPDLVTLAKAIGGGLPIGAVGGNEEVMTVVTDGTMEQEGTFNGNPLSMAAARAVLSRCHARRVPGDGRGRTGPRRGVRAGHRGARARRDRRLGAVPRLDPLPRRGPAELPRGGGRRRPVAAPGVAVPGHRRRIHARGRPVDVRRHASARRTSRARSRTSPAFADADPSS